MSGGEQDGELHTGVGVEGEVIAKVVLRSGVVMLGGEQTPTRLRVARVVQADGRVVAAPSTRT